jgi:hypothetical protein
MRLQAQTPNQFEIADIFLVRLKDRPNVGYTLNASLQRTVNFAPCSQKVGETLWSVVFESEHNSIIQVFNTKKLFK